MATEVIVDSSSQPLLQTEDANITTSVDARSIEQLPVPGGDISTLAFTAPGVNLSTGAGYGGFVAFGLPATANLFTMNGNDIMDPYLNLNNSGASNLTLGANELADVAIVNNGYTAQYGRYPGTQVNYTTKSGGNQFHGNAQWYWNGRALNANDWINKNTGGDRPFCQLEPVGWLDGRPHLARQALLLFRYRRYALCTPWWWRYHIYPHNRVHERRRRKHRARQSV